MKAEYKRDLQNNYLILEAPDTDAEEHYGLRMAEQNQVRGLLPMHESRKDGKLYLHYEITSKQTLESTYEKKVMGYQDILYILSGIRDTLEDMRKYLLSPQQLLFAPEMIYVQPDRKNLQLCYYVREDECPIRMLAEFILKRLDHRDRQAVALGYGFFERASGENFSLVKTLKDILTTFDGADGVTAAAPPTVMEIRTGEGKESWRAGDAEEIYRMPDENADSHRGLYEQSRETQFAYDVQEESAVVHRERSRDGTRDEKAGKGKGKTDRLADRVFAKVHPAVLLSFLVLTVVLELLIIGGVLSLTESGGCFFLMLSVEILLNRRFLHTKSSGPEEWDEEEETEEYQKMLQEVYQEGAATVPEPVEETCCLIPGKEEHVFSLVCCSGDGKENYPDIHPGPNPAYIGKIKGDVDVLLNVSTVSRMHARIQMRQGQCILRDMNSKNGTFVNGRRLDPQEECGLQEGDIVAFAQIEYQVVKRSGFY